MSDQQYVTLVAHGGTPVRLANQKGIPIPTTGDGSLVFANAPTLTDPIINGGTLTDVTLINPTFTFDTLNAKQLTLTDEFPGVTFIANTAATNEKVWNIFTGAQMGGVLWIQAVQNDFTTIQAEWRFERTGSLTAGAETAIPSGGIQDLGYLFSTTAHYGIIAGTGAPTASMAKGSLYLDNAGGVPYYNTDGGTTWAAVATSGAAIVVGATAISGGAANTVLIDTGGTLGELAYTTLATASTIAVRDSSGVLTSTGLTMTSGGYIVGPSAIVQFGTADAASPVAQFSQVQSVVTGTANTAGVDWTFRGSRGTGTGAGGSIIFQTAPAAGAGSTQNSWSSVLTLFAAGTATFSGAVTVTGQLNTAAISLAAASTLSWVGRGILSSPATATLQLGAIDAALPVAQTLVAQGVIAGTSNVSGANLTIKGSASTGNHNGGDIRFQTTPFGAAGTTVNTYVTPLVVQGSGTVLMDSGTLTASRTSLAVNQRWNNAAVAFSALTMTISIDSAGTAADRGNSRAIDVLIGPTGAESESFFINGFGDVNIGGQLNTHDAITTPITALLTGTTGTVNDEDTFVTINPSGGFTLTLPNPGTYLSGFAGKWLHLRLAANFAVDSASANVVPVTSPGTPGTTIFSGTAGQWCIMHSDGTNWIIYSKG